MALLIRAGGFVAALVIAGAALAQQMPGPTTSGHSIKRSKTLPEKGWDPAGYLKTCGAYFVCYTGIPMRCSLHTRPYQSIPDHQCFCLRDGCP
jgi:hypothetical protein